MAQWEQPPGHLQAISTQTCPLRKLLDDALIVSDVRSDLMLLSFFPSPNYDLIGIPWSTMCPYERLALPTFGVGMTEQLTIRWLQ